jgi:hypothetical protein
MATVTVTNIFDDEQMFLDIGEEWFTPWTIEDVERERQQREEEEELATMNYEQVFAEQFFVLFFCFNL